MFQILLIAQYVYSMDLIAGKELPVSSVLEIIGFQEVHSRTAAFLTLAVKVSVFLDLLFHGKMEITSMCESTHCSRLLTMYYK